jgi:hypothetical protein
MGRKKSRENLECGKVNKSIPGKPEKTKRKT